MNLVFRITATVFVVPATFLFVYWLPFSLLPLWSNGWIANTSSLLWATAAGWFVLRKLGATHNGAITTTLLGAILVGTAGFLAGFFGPLIFAPGANQGPLLGIFITGPVALGVGGIAGFIFWAIRNSHPNAKTRAEDAS